MLSAPCRAAEELPQGVSESMLRTPGVYPLADGSVLAVGRGEVSEAVGKDIGPARAAQLARLRAEADARLRAARHLRPEAFKEESRWSVRVRGARTLRQQTLPGNPSALIAAVLLRPGEVSLLPPGPLGDCYDVRIAPVVEKLLEEQPRLVRGGGAVFPLGEGWGAIGVGYAPLGGNDARAGTAARAAALEAIGEAVFGSVLRSRDEQAEIVAQGPGGDRLREWARSTVLGEMRGVLNAAQTAGEWKTDTGLVGVVVVASRPPLVLGEAEAGRVLHRLRMDEGWEKPFRQKDWILDGGAALYLPAEAAPCLLIVERSRLSGNPAKDRMQLPLLLETRARSAATKYLHGLTTESRMLDTQEGEFDTAGKDAPRLKSAFEHIVKEGALGVVSGLRKVGEWQSEDGGFLHHAFVVPLAP